MYQNPYQIMAGVGRGRTLCTNVATGGMGQVSNVPVARSLMFADPGPLCAVVIRSLDARLPSIRFAPARFRIRGQGHAMAPQIETNSLIEAIQGTLRMMCWASMRRVYFFPHRIMMNRIWNALRFLVGLDFKLRLGTSEWIYVPYSRTLNCPDEDLVLDGMKLMDTRSESVVRVERRSPYADYLPRARCIHTYESEYELRVKFWMFRYAGGEPGYFVQILQWNPMAYDFEELCILGRDEANLAVRFLGELECFTQN